MKLAGLIFCLLLSYLSSVSAQNYQNPRVDALIEANQLPDGVVFEILSWEDNSWEWASPMLRQLTDQLHEKYPGIDIALISQGVELFDLARREGKQDLPAIRQLAQLSSEGMDIHICGNYAKYKRLGVGDFLDFVDVTDSGSAQLANYIELGFEHVVIERPHGTN
jgi:intracellular sulfur oxidation DsrE/DsrF family protein